jgi:hypothetical protein
MVSDHGMADRYSTIVSIVPYSNPARINSLRRSDSVRACSSARIQYGSGSAAAVAAAGAAAHKASECNSASCVTTLLRFCIQWVPISVLGFPPALLPQW